MSPQGSAGGSRVSRVRPGGERRGASISARSSLLRPTVSFAAGVEATRSRQELHARASQPSAYQPKATQQRPFKLACDERAAHDHMCLGEEALLGTEERAVRKAAKERDELAVRLAEGRERCRRSLSAAPTGGTPTPRQQRQDAHAARIAAKAGAQLRQEEGRGLASPTWSSSSRIGALHGAAASTAATGPTLATQVRAARHADLRAVWAAREAEEAGQQEAKRPAQLAKPPILPGAHGASEQLGGQQGQAEDVGERETPAGTADGDDG